MDTTIGPFAILTQQSVGAFSSEDTAHGKTWRKHTEKLNQLVFKIRGLTHDYQKIIYQNQESGISLSVGNYISKFMFTRYNSNFVIILNIAIN